jgi:beta-1,4-mannosyltransferase
VAVGQKGTYRVLKQHNAMAKKILVYPGWQQSSYYRMLYQGVPDVQYATYSGAFFQLLQNYRIHQPDVIHLHWLTAYFAVDEPFSMKFLLRYCISIADFILLALFTKVKLAWTIHNLYEHESRHKKMELAAKRLVAALANKLIVLGPSAVKIVSETYKVSADKIEVSTHGHFNEIFQNTTVSKENCRQELRLPSDKIIYLFPGTAKKYKGVLEAVEAFKQWKQPNTILLIAGRVSGELLAEMGDLPENIVIRNQYIEDNDMPKYLRACDWMLMPYRQIFTSASLLTAMGMGCAIIVPAMGTLPDYLDENGGVLYNPSQKDSLLLSLKASLQMNVAELGAYNLKKSQNFGWEAINQKTLQILDNL